MAIGYKNQTAASVPTPAAGETYTFIDSADGKVKRKDSTGAVVSIEDLASGVTTFEGRAGAVVSASGDYSASEVTNTPAGGIVATTVQAAINELDTEKAPQTHVGSTGVSEHGVATGSVAGFMSPSDKTKLDGVASGATANDTDANLKNRANHTGTQTASTISDFDTAADARVTAGLAAHTAAADPHPGYALDADVTAAQAYAVQRSNHTGSQTASTISDFTTASRTAVVDDAITDSVVDKAPSQNAVFDALALKSNTGHTHVSTDVTDFTAAARTAVVTNGINNGVTDKAPSEDAVFDALATKLVDPMTTAGDIVIRNNSNVTTRLGSGGAANVDWLLSLDSNGVPVWREENLGQDFGGGSDGDVTLTGLLTLTGPAYYNTLTMSTGGAIVTNGYPLYAKTLDLSACDANCIRWNGNAGTNTSTQAGQGGGAALTTAMIGGSGAGSSGTTGTTAAGTQPTAPTNQTPSNGGAGGAGGAGGSANAGGSAGGTARAGATVTNFVEYDRFELQFLRGAAVIVGGAGGAGGACGAGDGTNTGRGGAGGGGGGGVMAIYCQTLITSGSTPSGSINVNGGNGGNSTGTAAGNAGGGAGGGGGGGGYLYLAYLEKQGAAVTNLLQANGGNGGNAGNGAGTGLGGNGGSGGNGGRIRVYNAMTATSVSVAGSTGSAGTSASGTTGGTGGAGGLAQLSL